VRIIHLEDNAQIAEFVEALCVGHDYVWAQDSRQACALAQEQPFDAALVDLGLQRGDHGYVFLDWLAKNGPHTFRVLVSGFAAKDNERLSALVDAQLDKPFTVAQFSRTLDCAKVTVAARLAQSAKRDRAGDA
jgi:CheY-like chemotaxis protein